MYHVNLIINRHIPCKSGRSWDRSCLARTSRHCGDIEKNSVNTIARELLGVLRRNFY